MWVDDPNFDLDFHMRRAALPKPGGRLELIDHVQRVISRPLDRTKPLWELYLIEEMQEGLTAILTKVHHAMIDGIAAIDLASAVYDFTPEPRILAPVVWEPEPEPSAVDLLQDALAALDPGLGANGPAAVAWLRPEAVAARTFAAYDAACAFHGRRKAAR